ncbi:MAG: Unknown protein [uncultured Sulfurovum sp.]|uniref:SPOR domain-containing protein n=1 Tax=uncultured Sulfurovum sp. TaxID=269237 RepID=A0A6S6SQ24_9BACT|nr:MAG: Unknown protein [uncultured Sulfurovum sp.]
MRNIIILSLILTGLVQATKYEISNIKKGGTLNVRDVPFKNRSVVVGNLAAYTTGISIKECTELADGSEWCYINAPRGASHIEGWVHSYYLKKMTKQASASKAHIQNFLHNFYMADEENYMDKLQVFYAFPMQKYLWNKNVSLRDLRITKVGEYKKWPTRDYRMTYLKVLKRKANYIDVQTTVRWHVQGHDDYEKGKDIQKLRLLPVGNTFKVSALKTLKHSVYPKPKPVVDENLTLVINGENNPEIEIGLTKTEQLVVANKFYIKSGSFFSDISPTYLETISKNGFAYMIQKVQQDDKIIRRVFIGPFNSIDEATQSLVAVRANINEFAYIQRNIK